jgi:D-glycero-D-manno-heptose 1,7-bisphosphate phosphatase
MKLVILDRDGVINEESPDFIRSPDAFRPIAGSLEAIARFTQAGVHVAIATNQSGLARGYFDIDTLNRIHALLCSRAAAIGGRIDLIAFCPHGPDAACSCRKPAPGLLQRVARRFSVRLESVPVIGDSLRDLQAAERAGAQPMLVRTGNGEKTARALPPSLARVSVFRDLRAAAEALLSDAPDTQP